MLIALIGWLENERFSNSLNINFESIDSRLDLTEGFTKNHIEAAAKAANLEISIKGNTSARLVRLPVEE
ncbi:MAG: hypothetical protein NTX45_24045 [Proteobacteria bacterium]|nr:hypothetical protein [Pseudomonadota bacterium]